MNEPHALISIASEGLSAEIHPLGAQLFALRDAAGRDLLWNGDPAIWGGRAPILFPIIGSLEGGEYRLDGQVFRLPRHGLARTRLFELVAASASTARFKLNWDEETLRAYPFHFELDLAFALEDATLTMTATVKNLGASEAMPASFGFHPALLWPLPYGEARMDHAIHFDSPEPESIRRLNADGVILPTGFPSPVVGRDLALTDDLFTEDAIIFDQVRSRRLTYGAPTGPRLVIDMPDTPALGLWSKPGAPFLCIEPWHGHADPAGFAGDFRQKPGVFMVPPLGQRACVMAISLRS